MMRQNLAVHDRRESGVPAERSLRLQNLLPGYLLDIGDVALGNPELRQQQFSRFGPLLTRSRSYGGATLNARAVKEAFGRGNRQHRRGLSAPAGLSEDHDLGRVASEVLDVVADPFE